MSTMALGTAITMAGDWTGTAVTDTTTFIKWIRACEEDQEEPNVEPPALPASNAFHRCVDCGQFMRHEIALALHAWCSARYFSTQAVV